MAILTNSGRADGGHRPTPSDTDDHASRRQPQ